MRKLLGFRTTCALSNEILDRQLSQKTPSNWQVTVADNEYGEMPASQMLQLTTGFDAIFTGGSPHYPVKITEEGESVFNNESELNIEMLKFLMFLTIQEIYGKNPFPYMGTCYSAQILAMAVAGVTSLHKLLGEKADQTLEDINTIEDLEEILEKHPTVMSPENCNIPLIQALDSQTHIQREYPLDTSNPLFEGTLLEDSYYEIISSYRQVIEKERFKEVIKEFRERFQRISIEILTSRTETRDNTRIEEDPAPPTIITAFRLGKLHAFIGHLEYHTQTLEQGYQDGIDQGKIFEDEYPRTGGGVDKDGTPINGISSLKNRIKNTTEQPLGQNILRNWMALAG